MKAIYREELGGFFHTMSGYVYLSIFLMISGYYFVTGNLLSGNGDMKNYFSSMVQVGMFLLPMLTMRSFAEEQKTGTNQLLMSSPVSGPGIVTGKFLAVLTVFAIGQSVSLIYGAILAAYGQFDPYLLSGSLAGTILAASAFISIGLFISSVTDSQVVAGVISYSILMGLWLIGYIGTFLSSSPLKALASYLSLSSKFMEFSMGLLSLTSVTYYISIAFLFLFFTILMQERRRIC